MLVLLWNTDGGLAAVAEPLVKEAALLVQPNPDTDQTASTAKCMSRACFSRGPARDRQEGLTSNIQARCQEGGLYCPAPFSLWLGEEIFAPPTYSNEGAILAHLQMSPCLTFDVSGPFDAAEDVTQSTRTASDISVSPGITENVTLPSWPMESLTHSLGIEPHNWAFYVKVQHIQSNRV